MNAIYRRKYVIEFDVWEPHEKIVQRELDVMVCAIKSYLSHAGNLHITGPEEKRLQ